MERAFAGNGWCGSSLLTALASITARESLAKLIPNALSYQGNIFAVLLHGDVHCLMDCLFEKAVAGKFQGYSISAICFAVFTNRTLWHPAF